MGMANCGCIYASTFASSYASAIKKKGFFSPLQLDKNRTPNFLARLAGSISLMEDISSLFYPSFPPRGTQYSAVVLCILPSFLSLFSFRCDFHQWSLSCRIHMQGPSFSLNSIRRASLETFGYPKCPSLLSRRCKMITH